MERGEQLGEAEPLVGQSLKRARLQEREHGRVRVERVPPERYMYCRAGATSGAPAAIAYIVRCRPG